MDDIGIEDFAKIISGCDINKVKFVLNKGKKVFEIRNGITAYKTEYLLWLKKEFKTFKTDNPELEQIPYEFDLCNGCQTGKKVVIFDEGRFPKHKPDWFFKYSAWNIEIQDNKIIEICLCFSTEKLSKHKDYAY